MTFHVKLFYFKLLALICEDYDTNNHHFRVILFLETKSIKSLEYKIKER